MESVYDRHRKAPFDTLWFRHRMLDQGIMGVTLAKYLGIPKSQATRIVLGQRLIHISEIRIIADILDVTADELLFRAGYGKPKKIRGN